jgi:hypothetical protein
MVDHKTDPYSLTTTTMSGNNTGKLKEVKDQPGQQEPAFSIENVEFVDERSSTRSGSKHQHHPHGHGGVVYPGSIDNSNNGGVVDERQRNYAQEAGYTGVPAPGYGATAYYAQQQHHAQQQSYYGSGGHQHQHQQPPPSQYYGMPPYQGYGAPNHPQQPPPGSAYGQDWQGMPQVYDYSAPPVYGYAPQQQQQQAYTFNQQQQLQALQQQQQQQHRRARSSSSPVATHTRKSSEPIHPLKRGKESTFTASPWSDQAEHASLLGDNASGYGTVSEGIGARESLAEGYMRPTFKSDPGVRGLDAIGTSMASALDKAGIGGGPDRSLPRRRASASALQPKSHRRSSSDVPLRGMRLPKHPPKASRLPTDLQRSRKSSNTVAIGNSNAGATVSRQRSFSASQSDAAQRQRDMTGSQLAPLGGLSRPSHHRRTSSMKSMTSVGNSVATDASHYSIVSDIRKSSFYGGVHEKSGTVQMHYPFENVYLAVPDDVEKNGMKRGHLYVANADEQIYENYHRVAEEIDMDEHWMDNPLACNCTCNNCTACTGKQDLLPPNYYAMAVDEDLYRRVLFEIAESQTMPCGLFFCGHHEDVAHPSICIAVFIVSIVFAGMGAIAFWMQV